MLCAVGAGDRMEIVMNPFLITLGATAVLLLTAVPGYLFTKTRLIGEECISGFSKVLLFVCQPCLAVYTFGRLTFSVDKLVSLGIFAALTVAIFTIVLGGSYLALRKRQKEPIYRIITIATTFSNSAFFGIPIIEALFPETSDELIIYTTVFALVMNVVGWTVGSAIISRNLRHISVKKIFLNPPMLGTIIALVLFVSGIQLPTSLFDMITTSARMSSPLSMIILGMRLGTMRLASLFSDFRIYLTIAVKQLLMPLVALTLVLLLPVPREVAVTFFVISATPSASIVLNFSEILGEGQKEAANTVLLSTMLTVLTVPLMMLLLPLLQ